MAVFEDFQQIPPLGRSEYTQPPIIEDQDVDLGDRFEKAGVTPIPLGNGEGFEEARDTVIGDRPTVAAGFATEPQAIQLLPRPVGPVIKRFSCRSIHAPSTRCASTARSMPRPQVSAFDIKLATAFDGHGWNEICSWSFNLVGK